MTSWIKCAKLGANESHMTRHVVLCAGFNMHKINFSLCPQANYRGSGLLIRSGEGSFMTPGAVCERVSLDYLQSVDASYMGVGGGQGRRSILRTA